MKARLSCSVLLLITPVAGLAQEAPPPVCPAQPAALPDPWRVWIAPKSVAAGQDVSAATPLPLGRALAATLHPVAHVAYAVPPVRPLADNSFGGTFRLNLTRDTRVGIALSSAAWVDVVTGTAFAQTVDHGHGPDCSGIRKIVWFDLASGAHIVQIANARDATIRIMAAEK